MEDFTAITSQAQLDEILKNRLERAEKKYSEMYSDYDSLKNKASEYENKYNELLKSTSEETSTLKKLNEELEMKVRANELQSVKQHIALESGLPLNVASRLNGTTEEEIRKDADALVKALNISRVQPMASTETSVDPKNAAYRNMLGNLLNK